MFGWGQGYYVDNPYTAGFYPDLAPVHIESALLFAGFKANLTRPGETYCELGCGYGLTTLVLAAANPHMSFVGIDFNPTHIVAANALAQAAQLGNVRFIECSWRPAARSTSPITPRRDGCRALPCSTTLPPLGAMHRQ